MSDELKPVEEAPVALSAEEVEKQIVDDELKKRAEEKAQDPVGQAATSFGMYYPVFVNVATQLSAKAARRLLVSIIGAPLKDPNINLKNKLEREAFAIASHLQDAKLVLLLDTMYKHQQQFQNATDPNVPAPVSENVDITKTDDSKGEENA